MKKHTVTIVRKDSRKQTIRKFLRHGIILDTTGHLTRELISDTINNEPNLMGLCFVSAYPDAITFSWTTKE